MVYCGTNYRASVAIFTFFYLADAAAFSVVSTAACLNLAIVGLNGPF
jgi:hypothetical protein